jgi:hypothetical protein
MPSRKYLIQLLSCLFLSLSGLAVGQVTVRPAKPISEMLWSMFGGTQTVEFDVPANILSGYVIAMYRGEVVHHNDFDFASTEVATIMVSALVTPGCPVGVTVFSGHVRGGGSGYASYCLPIPNLWGWLSRQSSLGSLALDVPVNEWRPLLMFTPLTHDGAPTEQDRTQESIVFLFYLSDEPKLDGAGGTPRYPQPPTFDSWDELDRRLKQ